MHVKSHADRTGRGELETETTIQLRRAVIRKQTDVGGVRCGCIDVFHQRLHYPGAETLALVIRMNGNIDDVAIWTRAISDADVAYLWNDGAGNSVPEPTTLVLAVIGLLSLGLYGWSRK